MNIGTTVSTSSATPTTTRLGKSSVNLGVPGKVPERIWMDKIKKMGTVLSDHLSSERFPLESRTGLIEADVELVSGRWLLDLGMGEVFLRNLAEFLQMHGKRLATLGEVVAYGPKIPSLMLEKPSVFYCINIVGAMGKNIIPAGFPPNVSLKDAFLKLQIVEGECALCPRVIPRSPFAETEWFPVVSLSCGV